MQEVLWVVAFEDADGQVKLLAHVVVYLFHHQQRQLFVRYAADERVLKYMRERSVPYVVHQYGRLNGLGLGVEDEVPLLSQRGYGL